MREGLEESVSDPATILVEHGIGYQNQQVSRTRSGCRDYSKR